MSKTEKPVKVLYFVDRMLRGGIQTFVLENWKHMDHNKVKIDFLLLDDGVDYELEDILIKLGSDVYKLKGIWIRKPKDFIPYRKALDDFFRDHHDYKVIHLHSSSKNYMVLEFAKKYGINTRIAHSHNIGFQTSSKNQIIIGNLFKPLLCHYATDFFACSENAGKWLFGNRKVTVLKNAVDINKYRFSKEKSKIMKRELGLEGNKVIGHVGRFTHQKNHKFLIRIFEELLKIDETYRLILVGEGTLKDSIQEQVKKMGVSDKVLFLGFKSNVEDYMQAMDMFVFPSEFEGLGLVLIEAQASGLPCFTSKDVVPEEAKVSDLLTYIPLKDNPKEWAAIIHSKHYERITPEESISQRGYSIEQTAKYLEEYYLEH